MLPRPRALLVLLLAVPATAGAWPVDVRVELAPGQELFRRLSSVEWVESDDPKVVDVELLPSGELLLSGRQEGAARLLLYADGTFAVWRVVVGKAPDARLEARATLASARTACRGLRENPGAQDEALVVPVATEACRVALRAALESDALLARQLSLTFDAAVLQAQLKDLEAGLRAAAPGAKLALKYSAGTLVVEGACTEAEHRRALWALFERAVGRVSLEDRTRRTDAAPDGGVGAAR